MKDMMPSFNLVQPIDVKSAINLLTEAGAGGWAIAGGQDSFDWFKDRIKRPHTVVDLSGIDSIKGIRETDDGGIEIGALTTLTDVEQNPIIKEKYGLLSLENVPVTKNNFSIFDESIKESFNSREV